METLDLGPYGHAEGTLRLPGSKSISNRVLLLAALSRGTTRVRELLASDDTQVMLDALAALGVKCTQVGDSRDFIVEGCGGAFPVKAAKLFMGNAGTAIRPLTAALSLSHGDYEVSGVARMHERPIGDLVDGLRQLGARIDYLGNAGYPPLHIKPADVHAPQSPIRVRGDVSSQFLTALLLTLPLLASASGEIVVEVEGELISRPYIDITLRLLRRFGSMSGRMAGRASRSRRRERTARSIAVRETSASRATPRRHRIFLRPAPLAAGRCVCRVWGATAFRATCVSSKPWRRWGRA